MQRIINTHPTQAFMFTWNSKTYIHQPQKGYFEQVQERVPNKVHPTAPELATFRTILKCVDPDKVCENHIDVPDGYVMDVVMGRYGDHEGNLKTITEVDKIEASKVNDLSEKLQTEKKMRVDAEKLNAYERHKANLAIKFLETQDPKLKAELDEILAMEKAAKEAQVAEPAPAGGTVLGQLNDADKKAAKKK